MSAYPNAQPVTSGTVVLGLLLLMAAPSLFAQISGQTDKQPQAPSTTADLPSVKVVFSEPKIRRIQVYKFAC